ncbi:SMR family transporter [Aureimonas leprariae]|uniref:QacE family quaternary ammonium compound efflux SMR transporter n=1 Tax=Plantimonas leprariae TaxID=2615207 RepID=A0A7V7TZD0_9HYPH|nr:SMR family transporter [Aureimonas leprariae]KAB0679242.1 QacE family quaternary ammonium compound efflux SMR transporter [Aureimonas leprariae]
MSAALTYGVLAVAIVCEVVGTMFLQQSREFTRLVPSLLTLLFYAAAFYFLAISLRTIPVGVAYAIWSGVGIVLVSAFGALFLGQVLDLAAVVGLSLIVAGVLVVNLLSKTVPH